MRLWLTRRHWNLLARTDPLWAVLTEPDRRGNRWKIDEFFATGQENVTTVLQWMRAADTAWQPRGRALDFGCGVGRLTQALAPHFDEVVGCDLSADMIALARRHSRFDIAHVRFVENTHADLRLFPDGSFDFVLSLITLQHVAPEYTRRYLAEFVRILAPGGVLAVQLPDRWLRPPAGRRFSWWPGTLLRRALPRIKQWLVLEPTMEMHMLPRAEVEAILREAGAELLAVQPMAAAGPDFTSFCYLARRRDA
jgi:ubiquinone/menaquinone biosynthesis C-methylase UbiE